MANIIQDVKPRGIASAYVEAPFDEGKEALEKQGYRIISLQENAKLRMQEGKDAYVSQNGNWTREGVLYIPKKGIFLAKNSPIMENAKEATDCHRNGKEFYLNKKQVEKALIDSIKLSDKPIPASRFGENKITNYAFGDSAKDYGLFLKDAGIGEMPVHLCNLEGKPFARQMWLRWLGGLSGLGGCSGGLSYWARGVCENAEGVAKNSEAYTSVQLEKALNELGFPGITKNLVDKLRGK